MNRILIPVAVFFMLLSSFSHRTENSLRKMDQSPLPDTATWYLKKMYADGKTREVNNSKVFIRLDVANGKAGGKGGCNTFGAKLSISNDSIQFKQIFSTEMFCEEMQETENLFLKQLEKATRFKVEGNEMKIMAGEEILLELSKG